MLITKIERALAPTEAKITQSALLRDHVTFEDREVDILIETVVGKHHVRIGIEVVDRSRPVSTPWVESIAQKHRDLPLDKSIIVSRSGFYRPARKKAQSKNISTLSFEEAIKADWSRVVRLLPGVRIKSFLRPYLTGITVCVRDSVPSTLLFKDAIPKLTVYHADGRPGKTLGDLVESYVSNPALIEACEKHAFEDATSSITLDVPFKPGAYVLDQKNFKHVVSGLQIALKCRKETSRTEMIKGEYLGVAVASTTGSSFGHPVHIAILEKPDEPATISLSFSNLKAKAGTRKKKRPSGA